MKRRVVITAMAALSPIGNDLASIWKSILAGKCGIDKITKFDTSDFKVKLAAELKDLNYQDYFERKQIRNDDFYTLYARIASKIAMKDIDTTCLNKDRCGVIIASGIGGIQSIADNDKTLLERGNRKVSPYFIPKSLINTAASSVAIDLDFHGCTEAIVTACAASSNAIGESFRKIKDGYQDLIVTGGSEASITPLAIAGFQAMKALHTNDDPQRASIPFDKNRSGFVMGEGSAILVLEELGHALKRKAKIYGEIVGYGTSSDAYHITSPLLDGSIVAKAMEKAIDEANITSKEIDYLNVHGTSTKLNDLTESNAIKNVFKDEIDISSTKSYTGHLLGASGALEVIISALAINNSMVPPTINLLEPDSNCYPNVTQLKKKNLKYVMSNSLGFGGHNASLIIKKWED